MEDRFKQLSTDQLTQLITDAVAEYLNRREDVKNMYKQHAGGETPNPWQKQCISKVFCQDFCSKQEGRRR